MRSASQRAVVSVPPQTSATVVGGSDDHAPPVARTLPGPLPFSADDDAADAGREADADPANVAPAPVLPTQRSSGARQSSADPTQLADSDDDLAAAPESDADFAAPAPPLRRSATQEAILAAAARDDPREVPMEWRLPGGVGRWTFLLPWLPLAALLGMWDGVVPDAAPPPDLLFILHGLLGRCAGCYLWGQTKPTLMTHGARLYYSDSAAQCPACTQTKFRPECEGEIIDTRVWHEISSAELEGAYGRHTFAAVLYPTTSPHMIDSVLRSTPVRELRLTSAALTSQLNRIHACSYLQVLHLSRCGLHDANLQVLRTCAPQLRGLNLSGNQLSSLNVIADRLLELRWLDVSHTPIGQLDDEPALAWLTVTLPRIGKLRRFVAMASASDALIRCLAEAACVEEVLISQQARLLAKLSVPGSILNVRPLRKLPRLRVLITCFKCRWKPKDFPQLKAASLGRPAWTMPADAATAAAAVIPPHQLPIGAQLSLFHEVEMPASLAALVAVETHLHDHADTIYRACNGDIDHFLSSRATRAIHRE